MFIFISKYVKPLDEVDVHRPAHLAWIQKNVEDGVILISGRQNPPVGGVIILRAANLEEAQAIMATDPFAANGVAEYAPTEFTPSGPPSRTPEVEAFLARPVADQS
jgi:uncharacterized protein YciI